MRDLFSVSDPLDPDKNRNHPNSPSPVRKTLNFLGQFRHFGWDLVGLGLIILSLLSLLGLFGITKGLLVDRWIELITHLFGWGSILAILMVAGAGVAAFRYSAGYPFPLSFGRVISIEVSFFSLLACFSLYGGFSLARAETGKDGGILGWGLARIFPQAIGILVYSLLFLLFLSISLGVFHKLLRRVLSWAEGTDSGKKAKQVSEKAVTGGRVKFAQKDSASETPASIEKPGLRDDRLPPLNLLMSEHNVAPDPNFIKARALTIEKTLAEFGLPAKVIGYRVGPSVTQFAVEPGFTTKPGPDGTLVKQKVRVSQISALSRDLTLALSASRLRIETPVPGRAFVGIEVPNQDNNVVRLRPVLENSEFRALSSPLGLGLGRNVSGEVVVADLEKMPHLLIAGTTNSGKSVCITALTTCLVMNNSPRDLRLVMLDPKRVELVRFNGLPHLLGIVETELERMLAVLRWALAEMDARYRLMADAKARNIESYNHKMLQKSQPTLPRIVILIDELSDLMLTAPDQTEHSLIRLAQMARATGIHLIVATQRPSTDVVTGLIKANFPARISFAVASSVDSRVVLDTAGAETLLGRGDMLFMDPAKSGFQRLQGIMVSDNEIDKVIHHWQRIQPVAESPESPWESMTEPPDEIKADQLVEQAVGVVRAAGKASVSLLQRRLRVGYPRAASLMDQLEEMGVVGPSKGSGKDREVLIGPANDADEDI